MQGFCKTPYLECCLRGFEVPNPWSARKRALIATLATVFVSGREPQGLLREDYSIFCFLGTSSCLRPKATALPARVLAAVCAGPSFAARVLFQGRRMANRGRIAQQTDSINLKIQKRMPLGLECFINRKKHTQAGKGHMTISCGNS